MRVLPGSATANVIWLDEVDSTNAVAERLVAAWLAAEEERLSETLVVAGRQTAGRGRAGHAWESPVGGLYATWLAWLPSRTLAVVPMAVGVTVAAAVEALVPNLRVGLKWPNDLLVGGRKLGGVLCESRSRGEAAWVIAGFGVNVGGPPALRASDPTTPASLRAAGYAGEPGVAIDALVTGFLARIHGWLADPLATVRAWAERTVHRPGERMRVRVDGGVVEGTFVRILDDGRLELSVDGGVRLFAAGELVGNEQGG